MGSNDRPGYQCRCRSSVTLAELLFGIRALPAGERKNLLARAMDGMLELFEDRVLPFDTDAARHCAELAVTARNTGRGFPTPDGYVAAIAASRGSSWRRATRPLSKRAVLGS